LHELVELQQGRAVDEGAGFLVVDDELVHHEEAHLLGQPPALGQLRGERVLLLLP
jgi:hypothetical protein